MTFNYSEYLKRHLMIGQIDPWRVDIDGKPIYALLVPFDSALNECKEWSGQDLTRGELLQDMKENNIFVFRNVDEFGKIRDKLREEEKLLKKEAKGHKKALSEERRKKLQEHAAKIRELKNGGTA